MVEGVFVHIVSAHNHPVHHGALAGCVYFPFRRISVRIIAPSSTAYRRWVIAKCATPIEVCEDLEPVADWYLHIVLDAKSLVMAMASLHRNPDTTLIVFGCEPIDFPKSILAIEIRIAWPEAHIFETLEKADAFLQGKLAEVVTA